MNAKANIQIHFIDTDSDKMVAKEFVCHVPCVGNEIRVGGEGNERYYSVNRVVWVYDEETFSDFDRVNIGVTECT